MVKLLFVLMNEYRLWALPQALTARERRYPGLVEGWGYSVRAVNADAALERALLDDAVRADMAFLASHGSIQNLCCFSRLRKTLQGRPVYFTSTMGDELAELLPELGLEPSLYAALDAYYQAGSPEDLEELMLCAVNGRFGGGYPLRPPNPPRGQGVYTLEGFLPPGMCVVWGVIALPFVLAGYFSLKRTAARDRHAVTLIAMAGAFIFVISSLKIPSVTGSCSHMTGTGLGAILLGPAAVSVLGIIVLLFQAVLLAHGGLTTLGANTFSMAIAGPFVSFGLYHLCRKLKVNSRVSIFLAAFLGDLFTYCVTSIQLALAYPSEAGGVGASTLKFLGVFAPTQLPLAVIEGILTVVIVIGLETYAVPELKSIGFLREKEAK